MKPIICVLLLLTIINRADAQDRKVFRFSSWNQAGFLTGEAAEAFHLQTVNGVQHKSLFAGLGIGLDYYYERTVPVFFNVRKQLRTRGSTPFVYAGMGYNLPWINDRSLTGSRSDYAKGGYYDAGIGYWFVAGEKAGFSISLGYSQKAWHETRYVRRYDYIGVGDGQLPETKEYYDYKLRRLSLRMGLTF